MSSILYNMIHTRAEANWSKSTKLSVHNYHLWVKHWFATAEALRNEFYNAGLPATGDAVQNIIEEQRKIQEEIDKYEQTRVPTVDQRAS